MKKLMLFAVALFVFVLPSVTVLPLELRAVPAPTPTVMQATRDVRCPPMGMCKDERLGPDGWTMCWFNGSSWQFVESEPWIYYCQTSQDWPTPPVFPGQAAPFHYAPMPTATTTPTVAPTALPTRTPTPTATPRPRPDVLCIDGCCLCRR